MGGPEGMLDERKGEEGPFGFQALRPPDPEICWQRPEEAYGDLTGYSPAACRGYCAAHSCLRPRAHSA